MTKAKTEYKLSAATKKRFHDIATKADKALIGAATNKQDDLVEAAIAELRGVNDKATLNAAYKALSEACYPDDTATHRSRRSECVSIFRVRDYWKDITSGVTKHAPDKVQNVARLRVARMMYDKAGKKGNPITHGPTVAMFKEAAKGKSQTANSNRKPEDIIADKIKVMHEKGFGTSDNDAAHKALLAALKAFVADKPKPKAKTAQAKADEAAGITHEELGDVLKGLGIDGRKAAGLLRKLKNKRK